MVKKVTIKQKEIEGIGNVLRETFSFSTFKRLEKNLYK